ncbi:MAG TPA: hypothetical protein VF399_03610 [bacterium]
MIPRSGASALRDFCHQQTAVYQQKVSLFHFFHMFHRTVKIGKIMKLIGNILISRMEGGEMFDWMVVDNY